MPSLTSPTTARATARSTIRFQPVVHLLAGDMLGVAVEEMVEFEERVSFGPVTGKTASMDPAAWLAERLVRVASAIWADGAQGRPILVPAPMAALVDQNTAVACDAAVRRTTLCQQEFCLVFSDAAFSAEDVDSTSRVARLRKHGFRVGIDMRRSWQTGLSDSMRLMIDTIRVDAGEIEQSAELQEIVAVARSAGILVVADNANWRDGSHLGSTGIDGAVAPRCDA
ncbi:MAG: EAL domain-containing protein [Hyphomonas sp.]